MKKKRGPQINGRILKTESFLRSIAAKVRNRAEAHNLQRSRAEDTTAGETLRSISRSIDAAANSLRSPELPLGQ